MIFVAPIAQRNNQLEVVYDLHEKLQIHLLKLKAGTRVSGNIKKFYKTNTPKQKAYLHGVVIPIAAAFMKYMRHERYHVYEVFKARYLQATDDKGEPYIESLAEDSEDPVDTKRVSWFTDQIRDFIAMEYKFAIPDPDKSYDKGYIDELVTEIERGG